MSTEKIIEELWLLVDSIEDARTLKQRLDRKEGLENWLTQTLQAERTKRDEMVAALYEVDVDKEPTIQEEAWANQFNSKCQAFWYGEAQAIRNIRETFSRPNNNE